MEGHCDSASNAGWDISYYAAYLCKRLLAKVCLALQKYKLRVASGVNLPDPAPRGAYRGRAPQNENCALPQARTVPRRKKQARGFSERKSRPKLVFFVDLHRILGRFWD